MKINPYNSVQHQLYRKQIERQEEQTSRRAMTADKVEISSEALEMQKGTPFEKARQEKVQQLKERIEAGEYKVDAKAVAAKFYHYWNE